MAQTQKLRVAADGRARNKGTSHLSTRYGPDLQRIKEQASKLSDLEVNDPPPPS